MEKGKGRVHNYVVSNKEMFCNALERNLCKMQLQYVRVENEFHFNDKIYKFYSFDECLELNEQVVFVQLDKEKLVSLNPHDLLLARTSDDLVGYLDSTQDIVVDVPEIKIDNKSKGKCFTKQKLKHDNKMINHKLKNSYKQQTFRNRRNG